MWALAVILLQVLAFSDALQWYVQKIWITPEEGFALTATLLLLCFMAIHNYSEKKSPPFSLWPTCLFLIIYGLSWLFFPPIITAGIAITSILTFFYRSFISRKLPVALFLMILLSLPMIHSLQFYLGYPARLLSAALTVPLLRLSGFMVSQEGTYLLWDERMLQFDAPCSGVNMLWAGLFLASIISFLYRFNTLKTLIAVFSCFLVVLLSNVLRTSSLFFLELGLIPKVFPAQHDAVGIVSFSVAALCLLLILESLNKWRFLESKS